MCGLRGKESRSMRNVSQGTGGRGYHAQLVPPKHVWPLIFHLDKLRHREIQHLVQSH